MWWWEADRERKHQKQAATCDAYRVANQQRMAAMRGLEWIGTSKARLVLDMKYQNCFLQLNTWLPTGCSTNSRVCKKILVSWKVVGLKLDHPDQWQWPWFNPSLQQDKTQMLCRWLPPVLGGYIHQLFLCSNSSSLDCSLADAISAVHA